MVEKRDVLFTPAGSTRRLHIFLPEGYGESDERYPVMYFFDGHNLFFNEDATYGKSWGLREFLTGWEKKLIIVGVECSHEGASRLTEYCPYHFTKGFLGEINGTGDATVRWMIDELKPMIDAQYRTMPFRECTAIGGSSMGGLMSLYAALDYNGAFSRAACLSPSLWVHPRKSLRMIERARIAPDTCIYFDYGTLELGNHPKNTEVLCAACSALLRKGVDLTFRLVPGGTHSEESWAQRVPVMMKCLGL